VVLPACRGGADDLATGCRAPHAARQIGGHQQRDVADVATDGHRDQALGAVQSGDLGRLAALVIGQHVGGRRAGERDIDQVEFQPFGQQMRVIAGRSAGPARRAPGAGPDTGTSRHGTIKRT
jgi:hypothetical protein